MQAVKQITQSMRIVWLALLSLVVGCAVQLAPSYDKVVVEGLNTANTETMVLMAIVSPGTRPESFANREAKYNNLIGSLDALGMLAGARPMPKNNVTDTINKLLDRRATPPLSEDESMPPSAHAIKQIASTLTKMRDTDRKQGLTALEAKAFKGQVAVYFDQAITYENFLQR